MILKIVRFSKIHKRENKLVIYLLKNYISSYMKPPAPSAKLLSSHIFQRSSNSFTKSKRSE